MDNRFRSRLLIADDHTLIAEACKKLLEPEFQVVRIVSDGRELLQAATELKPDAIVVDIAMPKLNGLIAAEQIKEKHRTVKLIFLTMSSQAELAAEAFRRGGSGYVLKRCGADELVVAVRRVLRGETYISPLIAKDAVDFLLRSGSAYSKKKKITARQGEVLQLLAEGRSMKEIAYTLSVKLGTIAFHKYQIMGRLGVKSNAELIEYAIRE